MEAGRKEGVEAGRKEGGGGMKEGRGGEAQMKEGGRQEGRVENSLQYHDTMRTKTCWQQVQTCSPDCPWEYHVVAAAIHQSAES